MKADFNNMNLSILNSAYILFLFYIYGLHCKTLLSDRDMYTHDFAVAINGTDADARRVAKQEGFIYMRKVC